MLLNAGRFHIRLTISRHLLPNTWEMDQDHIVVGRDRGPFSSPSHFTLLSYYPNNGRDSDSADRANVMVHFIMLHNLTILDYLLALHASPCRIFMASVINTISKTNWCIWGDLSAYPICRYEGHYDTINPTLDLRIWNFMRDSSKEAVTGEKRGIRLWGGGNLCHEICE